MLLASPTLAAESSCEDKVLVLEEQGIKREFFQKAVAATADPAKPHPRYILMAETDRTKTGLLFLIDTHTGRVEEYPMGNGFTMESREGRSGGLAARAITPYGGIHLKPNLPEKGLMTGTPWSADAKQGLAGDEFAVRLAGDLEACGLVYGNDICLRKRDFMALHPILRAEWKRGATVPLFIHPSRKKDPYWKQPPTGSTEQVCQALASMKTPSPAGGTGSSGNTPSGGDGQQ